MHDPILISPFTTRHPLLLFAKRRTSSSLVRTTEGAEHSVKKGERERERERERETDRQTDRERERE